MLMLPLLLLLLLCTGSQATTDLDNEELRDMSSQLATCLVQNSGLQLESYQYLRPFTKASGPLQQRPLQVALPLSQIPACLILPSPASPQKQPPSAAPLLLSPALQMCKSLLRCQLPMLHKLSMLSMLSLPLQILMPCQQRSLASSSRHLRKTYRYVLLTSGCMP